MMKTSTSDFIQLVSNDSKYSFIENPVPVFYMLYAYYYRLILNVKEHDVDDFGFLSKHIDEELYYELKNYSEQTIVENRKFFDSLSNFFIYTPRVDFEEIVEELISLLSKSSGRYANCSYSESFMFLINELMQISGCGSIHDVYGGAGSSQMMQIYNNRDNVENVTSFEPNDALRLISKVRTYINRLFDCNINSVDEDIHSENIDDELFLYMSPLTWTDDTIIKQLYKYLNSPKSYKSAIMHLPADFTYAKEYHEIRTELFKQDLLEKVILLPSCACDNLDVESIILVLSKDKDVVCGGTPYICTFIDARDYVSEDGLSFLGHELACDFIPVLWGRERSKSYKFKNLSYESSVKDESYKDWNIIYPLYFISQDVLDSNDLVNVSLSSIFTISCGNSSIVDSRGFVITDAHFVSNNDGLFSVPMYRDLPVPDSYKQHKGKSVVISTRKKKFELAVVNIDGPFYAHENDMVLSFDGPLRFNVDINYIAHAILSSTIVSCNLLIDLSYGVFHDRFKDNKLPIFYDDDDQSAFIERMRREFIQKLNRDETIQKTTSDLRHMLALSFGTISDRIMYLKDMELPTSVMTELHKIEHNVNYIGRTIDSYSNDFLVSNRKLCKVNEFIEGYICAWESLGREGFALEMLTSLKNTVCAALDKDQIYIMLDTILENARRHGFGKVKREGNLVQMILDSKEVEGKEYISIKIQNNGYKLPEDFTLDCYTSKGAFAGKYGRSGLGGYHVYRITQQHNGYLNVTSDETWGAIVEVLIPAKM